MRFWISCVAVIAGTFSLASADTIPLSKLDLSMMSAGWGKPLAGKAATDKPMRIGDREFVDGVGTHAYSEMYIDLAGRGERFQAQVGVDGGSGPRASIEFIIFGDGKELWRSGVCKFKEAPRNCDVSLTNVKIGRAHV